jgi:hypothetical protein
MSPRDSKEIGSDGPSNTPWYSNGGVFPYFFKGSFVPLQRRSRLDEDITLVPPAPAADLSCRPRQAPLRPVSLGRPAGALVRRQFTVLMVVHFNTFTLITQSRTLWQPLR